MSSMLRFPTMLRKMWSGDAIQKWLNENHAADLLTEKSFQCAVLDALIINHIYEVVHETNPRKALNDLICWEIKTAMDPAISPGARALINSGNKSPPAVTDDMVSRFLAWRLPDNFGPDGYVKFDSVTAKRNNSWPTGTNLLDGQQARAMLEHAIGESQPRLPPLTDEECDRVHAALRSFAPGMGKILRTSIYMIVRQAMERRD